MGVSTYFYHASMMDGVFMGYSRGIHGVFICIGYVSVMCRLCIGYVTEEKSSEGGDNLVEKLSAE